MKRQRKQLSVCLVLWVIFSQTIFSAPTAPQDGLTERGDIQAAEITRSRRARPSQKGTRYSYSSKRPANRAVRPGIRNGRAMQPPDRNTKAAEVSFPVGSPSQGKTYMTLGVTFWRVRLATETEIKDPAVFKERMMWNQQEREVVVTRISDDTPLSDEDFIQISIEYLPEPEGAGATPQNRAAYLYVINREQFGGGSLRNPRLIFPTLATYEGDNRLLTGKTVTLPDPIRPFRIRRSDSGQAQEYETYTIILSHLPLDGELPRELGRSAMKLSPELVADWERRWQPLHARADMRGGVGMARTRRELEANGDTSASRSTEDSEEDLTQDDPPPQIVFRREVKTAATMLITLRLPFK